MIGRPRSFSVPFPEPTNASSRLSLLRAEGRSRESSMESADQPFKAGSLEGRDSRESAALPAAPWEGAEAVGGEEREAPARRSRSAAAAFVPPPRPALPRQNVLPPARARTTGRRPAVTRGTGKGREREAALAGAVCAEPGDPVPFRSHHGGSAPSAPPGRSGARRSPTGPRARRKRHRANGRHHRAARARAPPARAHAPAEPAARLAGAGRCRRHLWWGNRAQPIAGRGPARHLGVGQRAGRGGCGPSRKGKRWSATWPPGQRPWVRGASAAPAGCPRPHLRLPHRKEPPECSLSPSPPSRLPRAQRGAGESSPASGEGWARLPLAEPFPPPGRAPPAGGRAGRCRRPRETWLKASPGSSVSARVKACGGEKWKSCCWISLQGTVQKGTKWMTSPPSACCPWPCWSPAMWQELYPWLLIFPR